MNILLVEDNNVSRNRLGRFLRKLGHQVKECGNGREALELFRSDSFHMVLSDIKMPHMSGIDLLRSISLLPSGRDADVVLFTGHGDMESAIEALRAGAYDYLLKPINVEELALITDRIAERRALISENRVLVEKFQDEVKAATKEKENELVRLREALARNTGMVNIGIYSGCMREIFRQAEKFHSNRAMSVLIQGETGTGKEVVARCIHYGNSGTAAPFVDINCATLNHSVFESELFGYEAGAFTGSLPHGQKGKLDLAFGGTLFLDEITELPADLQAKLLRVIEEREYYRLGGLKKIKADVRIVCATNADIESRVEEGTFRSDLYYRLNVARLNLPPLRERKEDIIPLAEMLLKEFRRHMGKHFSTISKSAADVLLSYRWPGNVRELKNVMEWVAFMYDDAELKHWHLNLARQGQDSGLSESSGSMVIDPVNFSLPAGGLDLESYYDAIVLKALDMNNGNKTRAARYLNMSWRSLDCRIRRMKRQSEIREEENRT